MGGEGTFIEQGMQDSSNHSIFFFCCQHLAAIYVFFLSLNNFQLWISSHSLGIKEMILFTVTWLFFGRSHGIPESDKGEGAWRVEGNHPRGWNEQRNWVSCIYPWPLGDGRTFISWESSILRDSLDYG